VSDISSFIFLHKILQNSLQKLFPLEAWSTSRLSHRPSYPAYYIADCWISRLSLESLKSFRGPLLPKPVTGLEQFFWRFLQQGGSKSLADTIFFEKKKS
jgi:hypothetical protein